MKLHHERTTAKPPRTHRTGWKVSAFLLLIVFTAATVVFGYLMGFILRENVYFESETQYRKEHLQEISDTTASEILWELRYGSKQKARSYVDDRKLVAISVRSYKPDPAEAKKDEWSYGMELVSDYKDGYITSLRYDDKIRGVSRMDYRDDSVENWVDVVLYPRYTMSSDNLFYLPDRAVTALYRLRYWVPVFLLASITGMLWCFVFLMRAAGCRRDSDAIVPCWSTKIPGDLFLLLIGAGALWMLRLFSGFLRPGMLFVAAPVAAAIFTGICMDLAIRVKGDGFWKNTLTARILGLLRRGLGRMHRLAAGAPSIVKAILFVAVLTLMDMMVLVLWSRSPWAFPLWVGKILLLALVVLGGALMMARLRQAGKHIAAGDLNYQADTSLLMGEFKAHGEALNHIRDGISTAVEQRIASEHMKAELITNVSHDLKTPLTSLINYSDLIGREPCDNPKITEYAEVLHRQSQRMKRLIEDLVEVSKASTGNMEVELSPCEAGVMLEQASGEYEEALGRAGLQLIVRQPPHPVYLMADGRRLWRIFDNLMNNICKYSLSGTRVYLLLEETETEAVFSFKNTSREILDLPAGELMERFVRGDSSRSSEGSGLGLSIAKSLTELQKGALELTVDGDLFKVTLRFPKIEEPLPPTVSE